MSFIITIFCPKCRNVPTGRHHVYRWVWTWQLSTIMVLVEKSLKNENFTILTTDLNSAASLSSKMVFLSWYLLTCRKFPGHTSHVPEKLRLPSPIVITISLNGNPQPHPEYSTSSSAPHPDTLDLIPSPSCPHPHDLTLIHSHSWPHPHVFSLIRSPSYLHTHALTLMTSPLTLMTPPLYTRPHVISLTPSPSYPYPRPPSCDHPYSLDLYFLWYDITGILSLEGYMIYITLYDMILQVVYCMIPVLYRYNV